MHLLALLTYAAVAAATTNCPLKSFTGDAKCRLCPATECDLQKSIPAPAVLAVSCVWEKGGNVQGNKHWAYLPSEGCYVWEGRFKKDECEIAGAKPCVLDAGSAGTTTNTNPGFAPPGIGGIPPAKPPGRPPGKPPGRPPGKPPGKPQGNRPGSPP